MNINESNGDDFVFPAHIEGERVQTVREHCLGCAICAETLASIDLKKTAYLAGLLHDFGKYTDAFRDYIQKAAAGEVVRRGSVNHTFAGVRFVLERWHVAKKQTFENLTSEVIASVIGGHHGLFDCFAPDSANGFLYRVEKEGIGYEQAKENFLKECADLETLDLLFAKAKTEIEQKLKKIVAAYNNQGDRLFQIGLLVRYLSSLVIDADRRDTAYFMEGIPVYSENQAAWEPWLERVEKQITQFPVTSEINQARARISNQCKQAGTMGSGIYQLSVPTGAGKTLSSLRYALTAAKEQQKDRIFFVIPLLSVLDQNVKVLKDVLGNDVPVLEHHSNLVQEEIQEQFDKKEILTQNWDAPIIVTTLVQLLNTLFQGKTACVRRMHALENSVIIIDEVQTIPAKMLGIFTQAMSFLATACNATIVLCSATQPGWSYMKRPMQIKEPKEVIPYEEALWQVFRRTDLIPIKEAFTLESLAEFSLEKMQQQDSLLLVCNTKKEAKELYTTLKHATDAQVFHLSTSLCMAHRANTLAAIQKCLNENRRVICVATQLVEAGVDFSFSCVIRIAAGLDNVIQAAGRCNRNSEKGRICPVYIVNLMNENLSHLKEIADAQTALVELLTRYQKNPDYYQNDLSSTVSVNEYYKRLYHDQAVNAQDYFLPKVERTMFDMLSSNNESYVKNRGEKESYYLRQAFKTAGDNFSVFDNNTTDIIVPYEKGAEIITNLNAKVNIKGDLLDFKYAMIQLEQAKQYTISLYEHEFKALQQKGGIVSIGNGLALALQPDYYSPEDGFCPKGNQNEFLEV